MIVLLSPAKTLDFESALPPLPATRAHFVEEAHSLARSAARLSQKRLSELMHISPRLAKLNAERFRDFPEQPERQALFAFAGDVYAGFEAQTLDEAGIAFAQDHVRMLSGLYGLLRPLDAIRPYRLEMGAAIGVDAYFAAPGETQCGAISRFPRAARAAGPVRFRRRRLCGL